jgi:hypothetical protein
MKGETTMKMVIKFDMDNASFEDSRGHEIKRILEKVIDLVYLGATDGGIRDMNGNKIGCWEIKED